MIVRRAWRALLGHDRRAVRAGIEFTAGRRRCLNPPPPARCGSAVRAGRTRTGAASCTRPTSRNADGSSTTSRCSTRSSSTRRSTGCPPSRRSRSGRPGARPGFVYAVKLGAFGSHRMKLRDPASWMPNHLDRVRRLGEHLGPEPRATAATLEAQRRASRRVLVGGAVARSGGRSSCGSARGSTTTCSTCSAGTAPRCASTTCSASHPFELTADWTYVRFHGPDALEHPYHGSYGEARLCDVGRPPRRRCSTRVATCTRTSTTTGTGTP